MGKVKNIAIGIEENTTSLHDNNHNVLGFSCDDIEFLKNYLKEWRLVQTHARFKYGSQDNVYRPLPGAFKNKKLAETILKKLESLSNGKGRGNFKNNSKEEKINNENTF